MALEAADVAAWLDFELQAGNETESMQLVVDAVAAQLGRRLLDGHSIDDDADLRLGVIMHCARLYERHKSPNGQINYGEVVARVSRYDEDVEALIGPHLVIGFA